MTANQLQYWKQQEDIRHNKALEAQGLVGLDIQKKQLQLNESSIAESARSNKARELETYRSNLARETNDLLRNQETQRANLANEAIRREELTEQKRHNEVSEYLTSVSNPFQALATTLDNLFGSNKSPGSQAVEDLWDRGSKVVSNIGSTLSEAGAIAHQKMTGTYVPPKTSSQPIANGVKQLPSAVALVTGKSQAQNNRYVPKPSVKRTSSTSLKKGTTPISSKVAAVDRMWNR